MGKWFNENMTPREMRMKYFSLFDEATQEELEQIKKEYFEMSPIVLDRWLKENDGWFADD